MTAPIRLTEKQVEFLRACAESMRSPWNAGSTTVRRLRKLELIDRASPMGAPTMYIATDAGRAWLAENGGAK